MGKRLFAVINERGPGWDDGKPMDQQMGWRAHADFMNALVADGFILLGGPFEGTNDVLLIVRGESQQQVRTRLGEDVWMVKGLLRHRQIAPWWVRLSGFDAT